MRRVASRNPRVGPPQPDIFGGETATYVPLEELTEEQIKGLGRERFSQDEFDNLDEDIQAFIHENDPESKERIEKMVSGFVQRHGWATEPDERSVRDSFEEDFDYSFTTHADEMVDLARSHDAQSVGDIMGRFRDEGYTDEQIEDALKEALQDNNNWNYEYFTNEYGSAFFKARTSEQFYMERSDIDEITEGMYPDEIAVALDEINQKTHLNLDPDDLEKKYGIEIDNYAEHFADADPDWEKIENAVADSLSEEEPVAVPEVPETPPEERVIHRFKDGFYVLDLLPKELPAEGKAMGMCVGRADMGYMRAVAKGTMKILSLRRPSGKPLFTIEAAVEKQKIETVDQVKGKANRLPGWDLGKEGRGAFKEEEAKKVLELLDVLEIDPTTVDDLKPALQAMKLLPPKRENPRRHATCRTCGSQRNPRKDFCTPVSS